MKIVRRYAILILLSGALAVQAGPAFLAGPILGYAGTNAFTLSCATETPAEVRLKVDDRTFNSPSGLIHRLVADGLAPDHEYEYSLVARDGQGETVTGPFKVRTFSAGDTYVFAATGDSRGSQNGASKSWGRVADGILRSRPMFYLHNGDFVNTGGEVAPWAVQFWGPAKELCARVPMYAVIGNHELTPRKDSGLTQQDCMDMFFGMASVPGGRLPWAQTIGPALFIGLPYGAGASTAPWLEEQLKATRADYIFVTAHNPAWCSSKKGSDRNAQQHIFPLLEKYRATAMLAGDRHCYERSEPGNGTTMVVLGNGGAPLYDQEKPEDNPHSKIYRTEYGWAVFSVTPDKCVMKVFNIEGQEIDTREWLPRKAK